MLTDDEIRKSREELLAEVERLHREVSHLEAAALARRRVQTQLAEERDSFREAFDASPIPQVWHDNDGSVLRVNRAAQAMLGVDMPPRDFTVYNDPQLVLLGVPEYFKRALTGETVRMPRHVFNASQTHGEAPDADISLETVLYPVFWDVDSVRTVVVQFFDLSAQARAEAEAARLRELLGQAAIPDNGPHGC